MTANSFGLATLIGAAAGFLVSAAAAGRRRAPSRAYLTGLIGAALGSVGGYVLGYLLCVVLGSELLVVLFAKGPFFFGVVTIGSAFGAIVLGLALVDHVTRN